MMLNFEGPVIKTAFKYTNHLLGIHPALYALGWLVNNTLTNTYIIRRIFLLKVAKI